MYGDDPSYTGVPDPDEPPRDDQCYGDQGSDWIYAGYGNDYLEGGDGSDYMFGEGGTSSDSVAVAAYTNTGKTYDFYKAVFDRNS